ncbi:PaaI family thioesterase [Dactylosporangium sp. AC04546]|uniref:PaaI family thioesterase n=1 Tax=Dactylosporangium sp. AC04546 TaxID=2862460 RepID=UPI001EE06067|nr:PaaI family thioesterase [Dactylosporangium sp. AC04546]WVK79759.1 PaaI family thioesterase [Dactylosporangium sp. AC04546]
MSEPGNIGGFRPRRYRTDGGGPDFARMIEALRRVQESITAADAPEAVVTEIADMLEKIAVAAETYEVDEHAMIAGRRSDLVGRGQALIPPLEYDEWDEQHVVVRLSMGRYYLGANGAAHGGVIPLVFDEVLGRLANTGRPVSRTAYLNVNFRSITPIDAPLRITGTVERVEGRKRFLTATLHHGDTLCADGEALFVALNPGQP